MAIAGYLFLIGVFVIGTLTLAGVIEVANGGLVLRVVSGVACTLIGSVGLFRFTDDIVHGRLLKEHVERDPWSGHDPFFRVHGPPPPPPPY
jgi:hypothetical protein